MGKTRIDTRSLYDCGRKLSAFSYEIAEAGGNLTRIHDQLDAEIRGVISERLQFIIRGVNEESGCINELGMVLGKVSVLYSETENFCGSELQSVADLNFTTVYEHHAEKYYGYNKAEINTFNAAQADSGIKLFQRLSALGAYQQQVIKKSSYASKEDAIKLIELRSAYPEEFALINLLGMGDAQLDQIAETVVKQMEANGKAIDEEALKIIYAQIYLNIYHQGSIGTFGPYKNGVDGDYGAGTRQALYVFEHSFGDVPNVIKRVNGSYQGNLSDDAFNKLKAVAWISAASMTAADKLAPGTPQVNWTSPPSITDWSKVKSPLDPYEYEKGVADPAKYLRFANPEQILIDPVLAGRLAAYARDHGIVISVTSDGGKRDYKDQAKEYVLSGGDMGQDGKWHGGNGNAAEPGTGWHELGFAIDIDKTQQDMSDLRDLYKDAATDDQTDFKKYGIFKPMTPGNGWDGTKSNNKPEPWHFQPLETKGLSKDVRFKKYNHSYSW